MAHGITATDKMFTVREPAWHRLGVILQDVATAKEAIEAANLGWKVDKRPIYIENDPEHIHVDENGNDERGDGLFLEVDRRYATVRSDTKKVLGIVGEDYTALQNIEAFSFMDAITQDPGGPKYVTAGSLHGGQKVWMLARLPECIEVMDGRDRINEFLLLSNTHDGSRRVEVLWTPVRVVCQNTLSMALGGPKDGRARFKHTASILDRVNDAQDILGVVRQGHTRLIEIVDKLKSVEPTKEQIDETLMKLFPASNGRKEMTSQQTTVHETVKYLFRNGEANVAGGDVSSGWALYNGITEYIDHVAPQRARVLDAESKRIESNWFGNGADLKARALDYALALK